MKLDGMKCPNCGSENTHVWQNEETNIWDDSTYKFFLEEFGENQLLSGSTENVIYKCKCSNCEMHFSAMAILDVKVKKMITRKTTKEIKRLKVSEVVEDEKRKD